MQIEYKGSASDFRMGQAWERFFMHPAFVPVCIVVGLLVRLLVAVWMPIEPMSDASWYVNRAQELAAGMGYQEKGYPTAYWPVGWPAILAGALLVFKSVPVSVVILNLSSAAVILWLTVWLARETTGSEWVARLALLGYAVYPNHIAYSGAANTETIYTALALAAFALLIKGRQQIGFLLVSGLIFGVATLVKPQTLAFPFGAVIALGLVYRDYSWAWVLRAGLIVYLVLIAVVLPWSLRNQSVLGEFVLVSTNGGTALILGANDQMTGTHFDYQHTLAFEQLGIPWSERVQRQVELNKVQKQVATQWIQENTASWLGWMPKKVLYLWRKDTDGFWSFDNSYPEAIILVRVAQVVNQGLYVLVLLLSLVTAWVGLKALWRRDESLMRLGLLFCMPVFVSLLAAVFTGQIRYHFSAMPFLFVAAGWAWFYLLSSCRERSSRVCS